MALASGCADGGPRGAEAAGLQAFTGLHLTLVCHRPHLPAALHQALRTADYLITADFEAARRHYYGTPTAEPPPPAEPAAPTSRWLTLPALGRLVSYDSPRPCTTPCTPPPIAWRHRPPPVPLPPPTAQRVAHRLHGASAHPRLAAALAAALFTGASLQQLATARPRDYDDAASTRVLHDRARYTDGCAAHPVPPWAGVFLRTATCFTRLVSGEDHELLAAPGDGDGQAAPATATRGPPPRPGRQCDRCPGRGPGAPGPLRQPLSLCRSDAFPAAGHSGP
ncbi:MULTISPECIES: hypothetical protein [unclassified Streptomyces]|uniref:hypothetical protein n=1 Tax=unclassified Streptomyces TaxID=2593676 RepID=UPI0036B5FC1F